MRQVFNFSPGPAMLPEAVLARAQQEFMNWHDTGMSVMEMSHRGKDFIGIIEQSEQDLRDLLAIPDNYKVLFLPGGARGQFAAVPLNLLGDKSKSDYINTGIWSEKALEEAQRHCTVHVAGEMNKAERFSLPTQQQLQLSDDSAYVYYCDNETIQGIEFDYIPETNGIPLVTDMTSNLLSRPFDVSRFGVIFASAQKNLGQSGITVVIVRDDLIGKAKSHTPMLFDYQLQVKGQSCLNTPPTFAWYMAGLVFEWVKQQGGVAKMQEISERKANKLYAKIDGSDFYHNNVDSSCRSMMNIPFTLANSELDQRFLSQAHDAGLVNLKGHRIVGGMRASIYLGMPEQGVDSLVDFMNDFEQQQG